jgi:hypothetical protein
VLQGRGVRERSAWRKDARKSPASCADAHRWPGLDHDFFRQAGKSAQSGSAQSTSPSASSSAPLAHISMTFPVPRAQVQQRGGLQHRLRRDQHRGRVARADPHVSDPEREDPGARGPAQQRALHPRAEPEREPAEDRAELEHPDRRDRVSRPQLLERPGLSQRPGYDPERQGRQQPA